MYSPWTSSMPCLSFDPDHLIGPNCPNHQSFDSFQSNTDCFMNSLTTLDLSNPFNLIAAVTPGTSVCSAKGLDDRHQNRINEHRPAFRSTYFEPLPFLSAEDPRQQLIYPQPSQKHTIIKQMISRKERENRTARSHANHHADSSSSLPHRPSRRLCTFCKSNGESAHVYTSHVLRNVDNEVECPVLMAFICPKCGATGKSAHTIKYCTALSECERVALPTVKLLREGRSSSGNMNLFRKEKFMSSNASDR